MSNHSDHLHILNKQRIQKRLFKRSLTASSMLGLAMIINTSNTHAAEPWALVERFNGNPSSPSQTLLPDNFEYVATHRTHAGEQFTKNYAPYPADHDEACAGPDPDAPSIRQHNIYTTQTSDSTNPDSSFFICKNHMMSSMGEVGPYSLTAFWPRQEFDFTDGGTLMFDVNVNQGHSQRHWWELMIVPRDQLKVGAGPTWAAIDENYPESRIVLDFRNLVRSIRVAAGNPVPDAWITDATEQGKYDDAYWNHLHPDDPALGDRRIRRTMRIRLNGDQITWGIKTAEGNWDNYSVTVPGGLPFNRGLVLFKTHSYTPYKQNNFDTYTFHWDNILWSGPTVGRYEAQFSDDVVYLQRNGHRQIGDSQMVTVDLPSTNDNPVLFGQINSPKRGQVLLSINGGPNIQVDPYNYDRDNCYSNDWKSFRLPLNPAWLMSGTNTLEWTVGPRPNCNFGDYNYDGFSVKFLHVQQDQ